MITKEAIEAKTLRWIEAVSSRDLSAIDRVADEFFADDYVWHLPGLTGLQPGPAGVKSLLHDILAENPDMKITLDDQLVEGDKVATQCTLRRTDPATGKPQRCWELVISRMVGDKVAEDWDLLSPWEEDT
jgi:predicted SnoaL-like aldol condensation-catalyzing enzyme